MKNSTNLNVAFSYNANYVPNEGEGVKALRAVRAPDI